MDIRKQSISITLDKIKDMTSYKSEQFYVRGLPWVIRVTKFKNKALSVHVACEVDNKSNWSCVAHCKFTLSSSTQKQYHRSFRQPREFSAEQTSYGFLNFISLKDLKNYTVSDSVVLRVKLTAAIPKNANGNDNQYTLEEGLTKNVRLTIKRINDFDGFFSPVFTTSGLTWLIKVYTTKVENTKNVSVMLKCAHKESTDWSCDAMVAFRLISFDPSKPPYELKFKTFQKFNRKTTSRGFKEFITWQELSKVENGYVKDNSIILDVEITVKENVGIFGTFSCPICLETLTGPTISSTRCGHLFCNCCLSLWMKKKSACPKCNQKVNLKEIITIYC